MKNHLACTLNSSFTLAGKPLRSILSGSPSVLQNSFAERYACVRPLLEGSAMQASTRGLGPLTELVGVTDLPLRRRVTWGQFLDLSESQVPHL